MIIHLFGSTTPSGKAFKNIFESYGNKNIVEYSRKNLGKPYYYCDFNRSDQFTFIKEGESSCIISFAPIWLISKFLYEVSIRQPEFFNCVRKILICSSSSVVTKKYSFNNFDQNLSNSLEKSEDLLMQLSKSFKIELNIIRPTLVYGSYGGYKDKNFSKIIKFMRISPLIVLPRNSGYRQPISCYQLANVFFSLLKNKKKNKTLQSKILIGGDKIITFNEMLISLKNSTEQNDKAKNCFFILIPNKLFILLITPISLFSRKKYESLLRIFANLSHFTPQNEITKKESKLFPNEEF